MRRSLVLVCLLGCGSAHAPEPRTSTTPTPAPAPVPAAPIAATAPAPAPATPPAPAPAAPPLETLARPGELFLLVTEGARPRCIAWSVQPGAPGEGKLVASDPTNGTLSYRSAGAELQITEWQRTRGDAEASTSCGLAFEARELDDAIAAGDARWFRRAEDCQRALTRKQRVATDLSSCTWPAPPAEAVRARTEQRFAALLARGGTAYTRHDLRCLPVYATADRKQDRDSATGFLWSRTHNGKAPGTYGYNYVWQRGAEKLTLLGPSETFADGSGSGMGCMDDQSIEYGDGWVMLAEPVYLTLAACRAAISDERDRQRWLPVPAPDPSDLAAETLPALGGC